MFAPALLFAISTGAAAREPALDGELSRSAKRWVGSTLRGMGLEEKAAQLVMVRAYGRYAHPRSAEWRALVAEVRELGVGGVVVFESDLESIPRVVNELQEAAEVPLLVASDLEKGLAFRVRRGTTPLPLAMAVGATGDAEAARFVGEVTAREGRALGIHWAFAPVADVNNNPANPIVNLRSFGEDPELVAAMVRAFVEGARTGGMLTTAKHFPGHGDTAIDSHVALPTLELGRERLGAVELPPFRAAVEAGVDSVMTGHIAVPTLDPSGAPATLSRPLSHDLLRGELGFRGIVVTDAIEMKGVGAVWTGAASVRAVQAGADVVLLPREPRVAVQSLVRAVEEGELSEARIEASARRLLETKARLGLHRRRSVEPRAIGRHVARPEDVTRAEAVTAASITLVKNEGALLPLASEQPLRLLHVALGGEAGGWVSPRVATAELRARGAAVTAFYPGPEISEETLGELREQAGEHTHAVVSAFVRVSRDGTGDLAPSQVRLVEALRDAGLPVVLIAFGSPYMLSQVPEVEAYLCAYGASPTAQRAAVAALFGEAEIRGRLPVRLPGSYALGHGLQIERRAMTLERGEPEAAGFRPGGFREVERLLAVYADAGAFPGGVLAVGHRGRLVLHAFGRLSYEEGAPTVTEETLYDLASLTKVVVTTTLAMVLVDQGRLGLDMPVASFLPRFEGEGKEAVSVRHLLTHSSGVDWWAPLYEDTRGKEAYLEKIQAMDLVYEPGSRSKYSDLGEILLGEVVERTLGEPLDTAARRLIFEPLGMGSTLYRPGPELRERIAPTEDDPWRGRVLRGEVHDENAHALGGVAAHAGLFGTAGDLARFAQAMLNGGVLEHHRLARRETVEAFTRKAGVPESTRALGWDTKSAVGSSAGSLFSAGSYGHTGFTGTSLWIDPERELFVALLTNRVHPSRENISIRKVRPAVADAVVRALEAP